MAIQNEPSRITIPFAASGTKNSIPDTQPSPSASQAASWTDGFPAQCSLPLSAGGIPPARADFNGIFNRITQSERFTQEGGVWLWNNAVDYAASRMVLGSDGKLYWSVAQSGPNVGGAVNPTTDNGTYWVKLPSMADIAAQGFATQGWVTSQGYATQSWVDSQNYATQAWVKGFAGTPVYVDPNGSDSNDGLSAATAVQTFAKAINIGAGLHESKININAVGGAYSGNISIVGNHAVYIYFGGNSTINGNIDLNINSDLIITNESNSVTVNGYIHAFEGSSLFFNCSSLSVAESGSIGLLLDKYCNATILGSLTISVSSSSTAIEVLGNSVLNVKGAIDAIVDISNVAININSSVFVCDQTVKVQSQDVDYNHDNVRASSALYAKNNSFVQVDRLETGNIFSGICCAADNCSFLHLINGGYLHGPKRSAGVSACIAALHGSSVVVGYDGSNRIDCITHHADSSVVSCAFSSNLTIYSSFLADTYNYGASQGSAKNIFNCASSSYLGIVTTQTVYTLDSCNVNEVFRVNTCSHLYIGSGVVFYGNANSNPSCRKYYVSSCSCLSLGGRDGNTLPGPQSGTTGTNGVVA